MATQQLNGTPMRADDPASLSPDLWTFAVAVAGCPTHRAQLEESEAHYDRCGASLERRDRLTLGLHIVTRRAVTA